MNEENLNDWNSNLPQLVFAYNTSVHSATGFTPFFLMFGEEARIPCQILFGKSLEKPSETPASFALAQCRKLENSFAVSREILQNSQKRMKDYYDNGIYVRIFKPGDKVRIKLKIRPKSATKLK